MKKCLNCNSLKELDCFYVHPLMADGHLNKCKECVKKRIKKYLQTEKGKSIERNRNEKRAISGYYTKLCKKMRQKYPEKYKARQAVSNALRNGRLKKLPCESCSNSNLEDIEAHHPNYQRPLDVIWLCKRSSQNKCHLKIHFPTTP